MLRQRGVPRNATFSFSLVNRFLKSQGNDPTEGICAEPIISLDFREEQ
jgi:hypothetical protein